MTADTEGVTLEGALRHIAALHAEREWREVPPNFPEIDQFVLWLYPGGHMAVWEMDKDMDWDWVKRRGPDYTPTHWMPLPEPPKAAASSAPEARAEGQSGADAQETTAVRTDLK